MGNGVGVGGRERPTGGLGGLSEPGGGSGEHWATGAPTSARRPGRRRLRRWTTAH